MHMWYNDLLLVLMAFVVLLLIVMAIVISTWPRRSKPKVEMEPPEKMIVEKGLDTEIVETELMSEEISVQKDEMMLEMETIESISIKSAEMEQEDKLQTDTIKQYEDIEKTSIPQVVKSEPEIKFKAEDKKEETVEIKKRT